MKGTIKTIFETNVVSEKFQKRDFVLTTEENYPQDIIFQLTQDKCELIEKYSINVGDKVDVSFNIKGREWKSPQGELKYFNTLEAWRIDKEVAPKDNQPAPQPQQEEDDFLF